MNDQSLWELTAPWVGNARRIAFAVAKAESGGNEKAESKPNTDGSIDRGLWQINSKAHPTVTRAMALNPVQNRNAAWRISKGGLDWSAWTQYKNGAYKQYMPDKGDKSSVMPNADDAGLLGVGRGPGLDTVVSDAAGDWGSALAKVLKALSSGEFWKRAGMALLGIIAIGLAVAFVGREFATSTVTRAVRGK